MPGCVPKQSPSDKRLRIDALLAALRGWSAISKKHFVLNHCAIVCECF